MARKTATATLTPAAEQKAQMRLVDPNEVDVSDVASNVTNEREQRQMEEQVLRHFQTTSNSKKRGKKPMPEQPPSGSRRARGAPAAAAEQQQQQQPDVIPAQPARRGGLFNRLRQIRTKETDNQRSVAPSGKSPTTPVSPTTFPPPKDTLGIDAFQKSRASRTNSAWTALTSEDEAYPALSPVRPAAQLARAPSGNTAMAIKTADAEKHPDMVERRSAHSKRASINRYSVAHSVEASLVDSWSNAVGPPQDRWDDGDDTLDDDSYIDTNWLKDGSRPPMVAGSITSSWRRARLADADADADDTDSMTNESFTAPSTIAPSTVAPSSAASGTRPSASVTSIATLKAPAGQRLGSGAAVNGNGSVASAAQPRRRRRGSSPRPAAALVLDESATTASEDEGAEAHELDDEDAERHTVVNELLAQLEAEGEQSDDHSEEGVPAAALPAGEVAAAALALKSPESMVAPSAAKSSAPSTVYVGANDSLIAPDDSVSMRAVKRATRAAEPRKKPVSVIEEEKSATQAAQSTTVDETENLAALLAGMEPAFSSDSDEDVGHPDEDVDDTPVPTTASARTARRPPDAPPSLIPRPVKKVNRRRRKAEAPSVNLKRQSWLIDSALTPEQLHYFVKGMVAAELSFELDRAFIFDPARPVQLQPNGVSKDHDYAIFKRSKLDEDAIPQLPLLRFLYDSAFCMLPMFGKATTSYRKRRERADLFWMRALNPMLRILQSRSLSKRVDRCGEGDGGRYSARSTLDVFFGAMQRAAVRYVTATLRVGEPDGKDSWPWPSARMMKLPAFTPYRVPFERQSLGGYDVDVVCARPQGSQCSYIIQLRKSAKEAPLFVIRSEEQFVEFGTALQEALPRACIKLPPTLEMGAMPPEYRELIRAVDQSALPPAASTHLAELKKQPQSPSLVQSNGRDYKQEKPHNGLAGLFGGFGKTSSPHKPAPSAASSSTAVSSSIGDRKAPAPPRSSVIGSSASSAVSGHDSPSTAVSRTTAGPNLRAKNHVNPPASVAEAPINFEMRRLQLRDWLRDVLACRGVGHHPETRAFLGSRPFTEKDMKKATKERIAECKRADEASTRQREDVALQSGEEVLALREQMAAMWEDCKYSDGFLRAMATFEKAKSFSALPEDYQSVVSYLHLQAARMLDGVFVSGDQAASNLRRARRLHSVIPWKLLILVMTEPTGLMIADLRRTVTTPSFMQRVLGAVLDDDSRRAEEQLHDLRKRLPGDYLRKIRHFVEATPDDVKRLIRHQADKAGIPLVAAIERGSDAPLLEGRELAKIISATKTWQALMAEKPTSAEIDIEARRHGDIALIRDLQKALQLYSSRRDGQHLRDLVRSTAFRSAFGALIQPILDYVAKMHHRKTPLRSGLRTIKSRLESLFELLEALRNRVHDPARSIDVLTTFLDSHAHETVALLSALSPLFVWMHDLAHTVGEGSFDLVRAWPLPSSSSAFSPLSDQALNNIKGLSESAWLKRIRQMEVCSRWIAGDLESDTSIQVLGAGRSGPPDAPPQAQAPRTRMMQILPEEPEEVKLDKKAFRSFMSGFRQAMGVVLESRD